MGCYKWRGHRIWMHGHASWRGVRQRMYDSVLWTTMEVSISSSNGGELGMSDEIRSTAVSSNLRNTTYVDEVGLWNVVPNHSRI